MLGRLCLSSRCWRHDFWEGLGEGVEGGVVGFVAVAYEGGDEGAGGGEVLVGLFGKGLPVVPVAGDLLDLVEAAGGGGWGHAGIGAGFGEVAGGLGGYAEVVELLGVLWVEVGGGAGEPSAGEVAGSGGAELYFVGGEEGFFQLVEGGDEVVLAFGEDSLEACGLAVALAGEGFCEGFGVGGGGECRLAGPAALECVRSYPGVHLRIQVRVV